MRRFLKILSFVIVLFASIGAGAIFFLSCSNEHREYTYYASGKVKEEFIYPNKKDKNNYFATLYYESGNVHLKTMIKNGKLNDDYWVYNENGTLDHFKMYKNDTLQGIHRSFTEDDLLVKESLFLKGREILRTENSYRNDTIVSEYYQQFKKDDWGMYGFLRYTIDGTIIEEESMGVKLLGADTVKIGETLSLEFINYNRGMSGMEDLNMAEVIFDDYTPTLIPTDSAVTVKVDGNKAYYNFTPVKSGYDFIVAQVLLQREKNIKNEYVAYPVYKLFYVTDENGK